MVKLKLLGIGKSEKHSHYTFPKTQEFFTVARKLLKLMGFQNYELEAFGRPIDKKWGEPIYDEEENIKKYTDKRYAFEKDECYIEIVFGKDKVFLMIHTEKNRQQELSKFLSKFFKE